MRIATWNVNSVRSRIGRVEALLERQPGYEVVAQAGTAADALIAANRYAPDIVILDVNLPDGSGIETCREIKARHPEVDVHIELMHMRPADALVERSGRSDLLVLGRSWAKPTVSHLGSVTRAVLREARCPVEVVDAVDRETSRPSSW